MKEETRRIVSGGIWFYASTVFSSFVAFLFWIVMARFVGASNIGVASSAISAYNIGVILTSAGINIAAIRFIASRKKILPVFLFSLIIGVGASVATLPLVLALRLSSHIVLLVIFLAFFSILSLVFLSVLIGLEAFRENFYSTFTASIAKLVGGLMLASLGYGVFGVLVGYFLFPLLSFLVSLRFVSKRLLVYEVYKEKRTMGKRSLFDDFKQLTLLTYSNYPFVFSNQFLIMASVYLLSLMLGESIDVGTLYIDLMILSILASLPFSLLGASLPISVREKRSLFRESLRIGLGLVTFFVAIIAIASKAILSTISPEFIEGWDELLILLLSVTPFSIISGLIVELNRELRIRSLLIIGGLRSIILFVLLVEFIPVWGSLGAALGFFLANFVTVTIALLFLMPSVFPLFMKVWALHIVLIIIGFLPGYWFIKLLLVLPAMIAGLHFLNILGVGELASIVSLLLGSFRR